MPKTKVNMQKEDRRKNIYDFIGVIISSLLLIVAIIGFGVTYNATRLQTSMNFCIEYYPTLQSYEFVKREDYLLQELEKRVNDTCAIEDIDNELLKKEIYTYCEFLNGIGIMIYEKMINTSVIIPYIGVKSIYIYRQLIPYLRCTRENKAHEIHPHLTPKENEKLQRAAKLYFVHYELLVLRMEKEGENLTEEFQNELDEMINNREIQ